MIFVMTASNGFILNAGKIIPVSRRTMLLVRGKEVLTNCTAVSTFSSLFYS
jgi:uncharacterized protein YjfI (DUF2170 family)